MSVCLQSSAPQDKIKYNGLILEKVKVLVAQSYPTLQDTMDCCPSGSSVHGIFQARILEWVAISFSRGSSQPRDQTQVSYTAGRLFTDWATRNPKEMATHSSILARKTHGQRSLEGCSPCGGKEWDTTEETEQARPYYHGLQGCCMTQPLQHRKTASRLSSLWICCSPSSLSASWGQPNFSHLGYFYCHFLHQESLSSSSSTKWLILTI